MEIAKAGSNPKVQMRESFIQSASSH